MPADLLHHRCVNVRLGGGLYRWEYAHKGRRIDIQVGGALIARDGDTLLSAIRAGAGIGLAFGKLSAFIDFMRQRLNET